MAELGIEIPKGSPGEMESGAQALRSMQGGLERVQATLVGSGGVGGWTGMASLSYAGRATVDAQAAGYAAVAMGQAAAILMQLAQALEQAKREAKQALEEARDAQRRIEQAQEAIDEARQRAAAAQTAIDDAQRQLAASSAAGQPNPGAAAAAAQAGTALGTANTDAASAEQLRAQAEEDLRQAQEKGRRINERWEELAQQGGSLLGALGSVAAAVGSPTGIPSPALAGLGLPLLFSRLPLLGNAASASHASGGHLGDDLGSLAVALELLALGAAGKSQGGGAVPSVLESFQRLSMRLGLLGLGTDFASGVASGKNPGRAGREAGVDFGAGAAAASRAAATCPAPTPICGAKVVLAGALGTFGAGPVVNKIIDKSPIQIDPEVHTKPPAAPARGFPGIQFDPGVNVDLPDPPDIDIPEPHLPDPSDIRWRP